MDTSTLSVLSTVSAVLGLLSILGSIGAWYTKKGDTPESNANAERLGTFVGIWAPTFFIIAVYMRLLAQA